MLHSRDLVELEEWVHMMLQQFEIDRWTAADIVFSCFLSKADCGYAFLLNPVDSMPVFIT